MSYCIVFLLSLCPYKFYYVFEMPMIKMFGALHVPRFWIRSSGVVLVSLVICTSTDLVHPTWLTYSIPKFVSDTSMRPIFPLVLVFVNLLVFLGHYKFYYVFNYAYLLCQFTSIFIISLSLQVYSFSMQVIEQYEPTQGIGDQHA
jgi:hypothetical protein